jgi:hypothetical protein
MNRHKMRNGEQIIMRSLGQFKDYLRIASFYSVGENISALREQPSNTPKVLFCS